MSAESKAASKADAQAVEPPVPRGAIVLLALAAFGSGISLRVTDALLPRLAMDFAIPLGAASYVVTSFAVAYGLSQLLFGPLGDRFGKYLVIAWACGACALTALLCALAPGFPLLLAARFLAGATAAAIIPLSMAWIGDVVPYERRQPVLARFLIGQILGLSVGVLAGGLAADHTGWRIPFVAISAAFGIVCIALFALNRRLPPHARRTAPAQGRAVARMAAEFRSVLAKPWARTVLTAVFLEGLFLFGAFAFVASHVYRMHGLSLSAAGSLVMLFGFGGLLFALAAPLLVPRLGETGLTRAGGVLLGGSLLAVALGPNAWWPAPACFGAGLGFYMLHNTLQINATQMAPERRGAAVSAFACCFYFGQSIGVALAGLAVEAFGTSPAIAAGAVGVGAVGIGFSRLLKNRD